MRIPRVLVVLGSAMAGWNGDRTRGFFYTPQHHEPMLVVGWIWPTAALHCRQFRRKFLSEMAFPHGILDFRLFLG